MSAGAPPGVLITRPEPAASALAAALGAEGWAPVVSPVLIAREVPWDGAAEGAAALAFTSAAAVRAAPGGRGLRALPVWAVGEATAEAAREAGFPSVRAGPSDAAALAREIAADLPAGAEVLHLRGRHGAEDFAEALRSAGLTLREAVVYEMRAAEALSEAAARALAAGEVRAAPVYSPRSGRVLAALSAPFDLSGVTAVAISEAAAEPLRGAGFARVVVAAAPTGRAMRDSLTRLRDSGGPDGAGGAVLRPDDLLTSGSDGADRFQDAEMSDRTDPEGEAREGGDTPEATAETPHAAHEVEGYHDDGEGDHYADEPRTSLPARALQILLLLIVGAVAALWFGPRLAPSLPAPVAAWLTPAAAVAPGDLASLRETIEAEMNARLADFETRLETDPPSGVDSGTIATLRERVETLTARLDAAPPGELDGRIGEAETTLAGVVARLDALSQGLEEVEEDSELSPAARERIAAFSSDVEGLKAEFGSLSDRVAALVTRIDEAEAAFEAGQREAMAAAAAAQAAAEEEIAAVTESAEKAERRALLNGAFAELTEAMATGEPFADALEALSAVGEPPRALADAAETGVPTLAALREDYTDAARDALEAATLAEAVDDSVSRFVATMRARLSGVPLGEVEGADVDAMLGRAAARLAESDVGAALEALSGLPEPALAAMADWRGRAEARHAAERAMADWRAALAAEDG